MTKPTVHRPQAPAAIVATDLLAELRELIRSARQRVATLVNAEQTLLYWQLGRRILAENLAEGRAEYGQRILVTLSQGLVAEFGRGFTYSTIIRMIQFSHAFPDEQIVATL